MTLLYVYVNSQTKLYVCPSVCLSICLPVCLSVRPSVCLSCVIRLPPGYKYYLRYLYTYIENSRKNTTSVIRPFYNLDRRLVGFVCV